MIPLATLVFIQANLVTVQASPEERCPSGSQVADALALRVPGLVVDALPPRAAPQNPKAELGEGLVLHLATEADALNVQLIDRVGQVRLLRKLPVAASRTVTPSACAAFADTVALVALRYLTELGVVVNDAPAPAPVAVQSETPADTKVKVPLEPGPAITAKDTASVSPADDASARTELDFSFGAQTGRSLLGPLQLALSARRLFGSDSPWFGELRVSADGSESLRWQNGDRSDGSGTLATYALDSAFGKRWQLDRAGQYLDVGAWGSVRWVRVHEEGESARLQDAGAGAAGGLVGWSFPLAERLFLRLSARLGVNLLRNVVEGPEGVVYDAPRLHANIHLAIGFRF